MNDALIEQLLDEEESASLDFKADQYPFSGATDEEKSELLKDILALANAWRRADAYILIGVEEVRGGRPKVKGVQQHLADAALQQFVNSKSQRPVEFRYEAFAFEGAQLGIIYIPRQERPIFLRADFGKLKKEVVYIRRGSSTATADPDEIARIGAGPGADLPNLSVVMIPDHTIGPRIVIGIRNEEAGGLARAPYLAFKIPQYWRLDNYGVDGNRNEGLPRMPQTTSEFHTPKYKGDTTTVIHPGTTHAVAAIRFEANPEVPRPGIVTIEYEIAAENAAVSRGKAEVEVQ
ncbi:MAG: ATP-binding protein [Acidobacteriia bacterium]|nr:ATP-binding protein [Terriglobia bacterium]